MNGKLMNWGVILMDINCERLMDRRHFTPWMLFGVNKVGVQDPQILAFDNVGMKSRC